MLESFNLDKNFVLTSLESAEWEYDQNCDGFSIPLSLLSNFDSSLLNDKLDCVVTESLSGHRSYTRKDSILNKLSEGQFIIKDEKFIFCPYRDLRNTITLNELNTFKIPKFSIYEVISTQMTCSVPNSDNQYAILNMSNTSGLTVKLNISSGPILMGIVIPFNTTTKQTIQQTGSESLIISNIIIPLFLSTEIYSY